MENQKSSVGTEEVPFLEVSPPPLFARGLAYLLLTIFVLALLFSIFINVPESITGSFVLVPIQGVDPVRVSEDGFISQVNVSEGALVTKGQMLFVIQSETVGNRTGEFESNKTTIQSAEDRLNSAQTKHQNQVQADAEEEKKLRDRKEQLIRMIALKKDQLAVVKGLVSDYEKLNQEGISSRLDITDRKMQASGIEVDLKQLESDLAETQTAIEKQQYLSRQRDAEFRSAEQTLLEERNKSRIRMDTLSQEMTYSKGNHLFIPAPCAGVVLRLLKKSAGTVVENGESLCEIACSNELLQAEVTVPQLGIARIQEGQPVKLLYDAFPYQHYGVKSGTVTWVSPSTIAGAQNDVFLIHVGLKENSVYAKGMARKLLPGMRGTARVVVDRRSLISYALAPIRQLRESMR
jgi:membrane fusion protein